MTLTDSNFVDTNYTVFVVEKRSSSAGDNFFFASTGDQTYGNLHLGYFDDTTIRFGNYAYDIDYTAEAYSSPIPRMHTFRFSTTNGKDYWLNGGTTADSSDASQTLPLSSNTGSALGRAIFAAGDINYFNGDIAEVIIFLRALQVEERQNIETYLSKKYNITIS